MPWADVRLNTEANFETCLEEEERKKEGEEDQGSIPPFGWYRWAANEKEADRPTRGGNNLRLPPIRDGRKISYISFIVTEEELDEEIVAGKEKDTENKGKTDQIENEETKRREDAKDKEGIENDDKEEEWKEDIFSHSLAPSTFRLALASLPQGIEEAGRDSRSPHICLQWGQANLDLQKCIVDIA